MSLPRPGEQPFNPFISIASNLSNVSKLVAMSQPNVLGERSVNIPPAGNAPNEKPAGGKKRKSESVNPDEIDLGDDYEPEWSAQQVRAKIRQFINSGEMKVGEFQKKIDVGSASYQRFMYQGGDAGAYSDTYVAAAEFFKKRQLAGIPISRKKVKADTTSDADANKNSNTKSSSKSAAATLDVSGIQLDGESSRRHVPIYDTCDDVRSKINRHLRATAGASNAGLVRAINAAVPAEDPISARHLTTLLKGSGATRGAESPAFYGAYVLFEKLRIKEGKPKTKKREEMEAAWGRGGMDRTDVSRGGIFAGPNDKPYINEYGQLKFAGRKW